MYALEPTGGLHLVGRSKRPLMISDVSVRVALRGDLDAHSAPRLRLHLLSLVCDDGPVEITVDLSRVTWIDLAGSRPLLEAWRLQQARGAVLRVVRLSAEVQRFLASEPKLAAILTPHSLEALECTPCEPSW